MIEALARATCLQMICTAFESHKLLISIEKGTLGYWTTVAPLHFALTEGKQAIGCDAFPRLGFIGSSQHQMSLTASTNGREV